MATSIPHRPRLLHPLMGADLGTLLQVLSQNGGVPLRYWGHVALALGAAAARSPFAAYERGMMARSPAPDSPNPAPIFIVGHWRSGTTHLYSVLSQAQEFAYVPPFAVGLPWDFLTLTKLFRPILERALPSHRFIDQVQVKADSPQEDEIALANMQAISFYHGLYFPRKFQENFDAGIFLDRCTAAEVETWQWSVRHFFQKLEQQQPGKRLLIKNPVYTARVAMLKAMWPEAKFIHIYRNPYVVFHSTRNFYEKLFQELALQSFSHIDLDEIVFSQYPRMMDLLVRDLAALPEKDVVELSFEAFEEDPMGHLEKIYQGLDLPGLEENKTAFLTYLDSQKHYRKNQYQYSQDSLQAIAHRWRPWIERWGYEPPQ